MRTVLASVVALGLALPAAAAELRIFATGASKAIVEAMVKGFEAKTGHKVIVTTDTAGGVARRIEAGEAFEAAVATRAALTPLIAKGKIADGTLADIASTAIGIAVKEGAPKPDISTVEAFRKLLVEAKTIAYVDPASGGTSGIYLAGVIEKMGLTEALKPKLRLQAGGYVAEKVARGEAEVVIHQISEILPVKGVTLLGGLPAEIQLVTTYTGALAPGATQTAKDLLAYFTGPDSDAVIKAAGMDKPKAR